MAKNILRRQFGNMYGNNKPYQVFETKSLPPIEPPVFSMTGIIFFTLLLIGIAVLYFNRARAYELAKQTLDQFKPMDAVDQAEKLYQDFMKPPEPKVEEKPVLPTIETKEVEEKEKEEKDTTGGIKKLDEKLIRYSEEQIVKSNGFCYIGYDQQRECTTVSEGDVCMSGQIFPTIEVCMNPHLRP